MPSLPTQPPARSEDERLAPVPTKEVEPCKPVPQVRHVGTLEEGYEAADIPGESLTGEAM